MQGVPHTRENSEEALYNVIGTQYLSTFGIPLLAGRNFSAQDTAKSPLVAIVNETLARRFFPNGSALGHRFCVCDGDPAHAQSHPFDIEIVGIVRDAKYMGIGKSSTWPLTSPIRSASGTSATSPCVPPARPRF